MRGPCLISATRLALPWPRLAPVVLSFLLTGCLTSSTLPLLSPAPAPEPATAPPSDGPRTLPQAVCKYLRSLHEPLPPAKDKDKENGNGNSQAKEEGKKNPSDNGESEKQGERGTKNTSGAGKEGESRGGGEKGKKNPADVDEKEKKNGAETPEKAGDEKDKGDSDKEKEKEQKSSWYSAHAQATMVTQIHDIFPSPYIGPNSLLPHEPAATSLTATLFLASRLWECGNYSADVVFNPELAGGRGLSGVMGIAGFPNEEISRVGVPDPTPYIARLYLRQVWGLGGGRETVKDQPNEIAGERDVDRFSLMVGKIPATDIADDNRYAHDPRTAFLNWGLTYNGAWDYPANVRGYDYGIAIEYHTRDWTLNYGIFGEPEFANGAPIDPKFLKANGQVLEWEQRYTVCERPGTVRLMGYLNIAHMGNYRQALAEMPVNPDVTQTRATRVKYGLGLNYDQELTDDLGLFGRFGWADGQEETWAFTEIDETFSLGLVLKGTRWRRPGDRVGLAYLVNGLSDAHRDYLAAGGLGFIIGDGRLNYGLEHILETYYRFQVREGIDVGFDFQEVYNPAYNRDRGPVSIFSLVVHLEI